MDTRASQIYYYAVLCNGLCIEAPLLRVLSTVWVRTNTRIISGAGPHYCCYPTPFLSKHYTAEFDVCGTMHRDIFLQKYQQDAQRLKFILFCNSTLHVSDSPSVHHQESKTAHTASGICHTGYADSLLASSQHNLYGMMLYYSLRLLMMEGQTFRNMQSVVPK